MGGKVQAPPGYADHVVFLYPELCEKCGTKICIEACSGQAIAPGEGGVPAFDREKCVHCGACVWNCAQPLPDNPDARTSPSAPAPADCIRRRIDSSRADSNKFSPPLRILGNGQTCNAAAPSPFSSTCWLRPAIRSPPRNFPPWPAGIGPGSKPISCTTSSRSGTRTPSTTPTAATCSTTTSTDGPKAAAAK